MLERKKAKTFKENKRTLHLKSEAGEEKEGAAADSILINTENPTTLLNLNPVL